MNPMAGFMTNPLFMAQLLYGKGQQMYNGGGQDKNKNMYPMTDPIGKLGQQYDVSNWNNADSPPNNRPTGEDISSFVTALMSGSGVQPTAGGSYS